MMTLVVIRNPLPQRAQSVESPDENPDALKTMVFG